MAPRSASCFINRILFRRAANRGSEQYFLVSDVRQDPWITSEWTTADNWLAKKARIAALFRSVVNHFFQWLKCLRKTVLILDLSGLKHTRYSSSDVFLKPFLGIYFYSDYMDKELQPVFEYNAPRQQPEALVYQKRHNGVLLMFLASGTIQVTCVFFFFVEFNELSFNISAFIC